MAKHTIPKEDKDHILAILRDRNGMDMRLLEISNLMIALSEERIQLWEKRKQINNERLAEKFDVNATTIGYMAEGRTS